MQMNEAQGAAEQPGKGGGPSPDSSGRALRGEDDLRAAADAVVRRRLAVPAVFFLELYKPLTGLLHNAALMAAPLAGVFFGAARTSRLMELLESSAHVEELIVLIERAEKQAK